MRPKVTIGGVEFDLKLTLIIVLGTILPMMDWYDHTIFAIKAYDRIVLYFIIPTIIIWILFAEPLSNYGFK